MIHRCSCHMRMIETPPGSADEFEVILDDDERLVVRRHARWVQRLATPVFILLLRYSDSR